MNDDVSRMKPLFIPLKTKWFEQFRDGIKDTEYRRYGPRWNDSTCRIGRGVVLSKGYGHHARLGGIIESVVVTNVPPAHVREIFETGFIICIKIKLWEHQ